jgi:hypothetical protein
MLEAGPPPGAGADACHVRGWPNPPMITERDRQQTAANTMLGRLEHTNAELNAIRGAVAPGVPGPAKGTDTDSAAQERLGGQSGCTGRSAHPER